MEDLAPNIVRQRLLIEGYYTVDVDRQTIERYISALTDTLGLRAYGVPTIFAPGGEGSEENQGYDAFVPLIDSGVSLYVWSASRFLAVVVFTCKRFDAELAIRTTKEFFAMSRLVEQSF